MIGVRGWYSTNILGNRDGLALSNEDSLASTNSKPGAKHDEQSDVAKSN